MQEVSVIGEASLAINASLHDVLCNIGEVDGGGRAIHDAPRGEALASMTASQPIIGFVTATV